MPAISVMFIAMRYQPRETLRQRFVRAAAWRAGRILGPADGNIGVLDTARSMAFRMSLPPSVAGVGFGRFDVGVGTPESALLRLGGFDRSFVQGFLEKPPRGVTELWTVNPPSAITSAKVDREPKSYTQFVIPHLEVVSVAGIERMSEETDDVALVVRSEGLAILADPEPPPRLR